MRYDLPPKDMRTHTVFKTFYVTYYITQLIRHLFLKKIVKTHSPVLHVFDTFKT